MLFDYNSAPAKHAEATKMLGPGNSAAKRLMFSTLFVLAVVVISNKPEAFAQAPATPPVPWVAPASAKALKNPVPSTAANLAAAKENYVKNCVLCHGDMGDGKGLMGSSLNPMPHDFTDIKSMSMETDGDLFWKMSEGRGAMLPMKDKLTETERWQLVRYIRTFAKPAAKPPAKN
jgi:mono/diheme cytochrome c family protein